MEQVLVAYGYCPECLHPAYIIYGDDSIRGYHDEQCSQVQTPVACKDDDEVVSIAVLLYTLIQPELN